MIETINQWFQNPDVVKIVIAIIGIIIISVLTAALRRSLNRYFHDSATRYRARKLVSLGGYFFIILLVVMVFYNRLGGLTVVLGLTGAGVALALQDVIASIAGWVVVSFGDFYRPGDRIQMGGVRGDVIDIGVLRTTIMEIGEWVKYDQYTGRVVKIANSFVLRELVYNYSSDFPFLWDEITLPVKFGSDRRLVKKIFEDVCSELSGQYEDETLIKATWERMTRKYLIEKAQLEPMVFLVANDNWLEYSLRYIVEYKKRRITKDFLFNRILEEIDKTGGKVSIASGTYEIVGVPPLKVQLENGKAGEREASGDGEVEKQAIPV